MRAALLLALLTACGPRTSPPPGPIELLERPGQQRMDRFYEDGLADDDDADAPRGPDRPVRVVLDLPAEVGTGTLALLGVSADKLDGTWVRGRSEPDFFWVSGTLPIQPVVEVQAPLEPGLHYFAVLNRNEDPLPGPGDLVSDPTKLSRLASTERPFQLHLVRPFEDAARGQRSQPSPGGTEQDRHRTYSVVIEVEGPAPDGASIILLGREVGVRAAGRGPFLWRGAVEAGGYPTELQLPLPADGMDVVLVLDVDGDGLPGPGDLASAPSTAFRRPAPGDSLTFTVAARHFAGREGDLRRLVENAASRQARDTAPDPHALHTLVVDSTERPGAAAAVLLVLGFQPHPHGGFPTPPQVPPDFTWRSDALPLTWPITVEAPLPSGLDLLVVLDLDDDGRPSPSDLTAAPLLRFEPPDGPVAVQLGR